MDERQNRNNRKWKVMLAACLAVLVCCIAVILLIRRNAEQSRLVMEGFQTQTSEAPTGEENSGETAAAETDGAKAEAGQETDPAAAEETEESEQAEEIPVDFQKLQAINPDVYAWITVPGTKVDYPIAQRQGDKEFYLHHNINGDYEFAGMIYTEDYNSTDFTDVNTVIYGHNMNNDTMFTTLHSYEDRTFFDNNREILIYTPEKTLHYKIFAAYPYDNRHLMLSFDFSDSDIFEAYLEEIYKIRDMKAYFADDVEVTSQDKIITLSTCFSGQDDKRYLIQAVLQDE